MRYKQCVGSSYIPWFIMFQNIHWDPKDCSQYAIPFILVCILNYSQAQWCQIFLLKRSIFILVKHILKKFMKHLNYEEISRENVKGSTKWEGSFRIDFNPLTFMLRLFCTLMRRPAMGSRSQYNRNWISSRSAKDHFAAKKLSMTQNEV